MPQSHTTTAANKKN